MTEKSAADLQIRRLLVAFNPPDTPDPEMFLIELKNAIRDFPVDAMTDGVTELIKSRRARAFPSIGDIRQHIMDRLPSGRGAASTDMHAFFQSEDAKRARALEMLQAMPLEKRQRIVRDQTQVRVFDFVVQNDRLPDADDYREIVREGARIQRLLDEAGQAPSENSSTFRHITWKAAEAIRYRRTQIAERLLGKQQEAAE